MCKEHNKPKVMYCEKCDELQCEICAVMKDKGHHSIKINADGPYSQTLKKLNKETEDLENMKTKFEKKKIELNKKIEDFYQKKLDELNSIIINEKKIVKTKVKDNASTMSRQLQSSIFTLEEIEKNLDRIINLKTDKFDKKIVQELEQYEKEILDIRNYAKKFEKYTNKKEVENFLNRYPISSIIPPFIEVKDLMFQSLEKQNEQYPDQLYSSFIHCEKKWRLYLKLSNNKYHFWFGIDNLKKDEVSIKVYVEIVHKSNPNLNISSNQNFHLVKKQENGFDFQRINLDLSKDNLKEYSQDDKNIVVKVNLKFQYDFFSSFINDIDN